MRCELLFLSHRLCREPSDARVKALRIGNPDSDLVSVSDSVADAFAVAFNVEQHRIGKCG